MDNDSIDTFDDLFEPFEAEGQPEQEQPARRRRTVAVGDTSGETAAVEGEPAPEMIICVSCGSDNDASNRHCERCGARLVRSQMPVAPQPLPRTTAGARALFVLATVVVGVLVLAWVMPWMDRRDLATAQAVDVAPPVAEPLEALAPLVPIRAALWLSALLCAITGLFLYFLARRNPNRGTPFGAYVLDRRIGSGATADIFLAHHSYLKRPAALKVLNDPHPNLDSVVRFEREARIAGRLGHPNTIQVFDYGRSPDGRWWVLGDRTQAPSGAGYALENRLARRTAASPIALRVASSSRSRRTVPSWPSPWAPVTRRIGSRRGPGNSPPVASAPRRSTIRIPRGSRCTARRLPARESRRRPSHRGRYRGNRITCRFGACRENGHQKTYRNGRQ